MDPVVVLLIGVVVGLLLGATIGLLLGRARRGRSGTDPALLAAQHGAELDRVRSAGAAAVADERARALLASAAVQTELAAAQASLAEVRDQIALHERRYADLVDRAAQEEAERRDAAAKESSVLQQLTPVQENLRALRLKVDELEQQRSLQHGELREQLQSTAEGQTRLRATTEQLASALRNNATRGVWGETQLRSVVESAGMLEHVDFDVQSGVSTEGRSLRPDLVVRLPGGKSIAVDAKVPFTAYLEASAIPASADAAETARRDALMKLHVKAVRDHVVALGGKHYWDGLDSSPEMVVAFIPTESLLSSALEADAALLDFAFGKHVVLASPATLYSVLKAIAVSWRHDDVSREARALFEVSRSLYGRLVTLATHVDKLGRSLERSVKDYNVFVGSLERQVLPSARRLSQLDGTRVLPGLAELDLDVREVSGSDLSQQLQRELED